MFTVRLSDFTEATKTIVSYCKLSLLDDYKFSRRHQ